LIDTYYSEVRISHDELTNLCLTLTGHPLAIDLAMQLLRYGETPEDIILKIISDSTKREDLSRKLLDEVFNHPKSTEEEKTVLINISVFRSKVTKEAIDFIMSGQETSTILRHLYDKKMITREEVGNLYGVHPLIREFCYLLVQNKDVVHLKAADYLSSLSKELFIPTLQEEIFYHLISGEHFEKAADLISNNGRSFIIVGYTKALEDMIRRLSGKGYSRPAFDIFIGDIETIRGEWQDALRHYEKSFSHKGIDVGILAEAYLKYGEILYRKGEFKVSLKYYEDAYQNTKGVYRKVEARSLNDIGLVEQVLGNLELAENRMLEAIKIQKAIGDMEGLANSLTNIGSVFRDKRQFKDAVVNRHRIMTHHRRPILTHPRRSVLI